MISTHNELIKTYNDLGATHEKGEITTEKGRERTRYCLSRAYGNSCWLKKMESTYALMKADHKNYDRWSIWGLRIE